MKTHRRQKGQIVWLMALCALPIALGLGYLFNSAETMSRKVRAQNGADAAALSQASWMARSMNVMATNNVAFVQTESILVAEAAVFSSGTDIIAYLGPEAGRDIAGALSTCPYQPACVNYIRRMIQTYLAGRALENLLALATAAPALADDSKAFTDSNDQLAFNFARFSAQMQRSLAQTNGLSEPPRMVAMEWEESSEKGAPDMLTADRLSTGLPVAKIDFGNDLNPLLDDRLATIWKADMSVQSMGYDSAHNVFIWVDAGRNFKSHGYSDNNDSDKDDQDSDEIGPWAMARNDVKHQLDNAVEHAKAVDWHERWGEEDPDYDGCWDTSSIIPSVPMLYINKGAVSVIPCYQGKLLPGKLPYLYGPAAPPDQNWDYWGITDVLVLAKSTRARNFVAPKRFTNAVPAAYGLAKARLYNIKPDLYSSDWHAVLVSVMSRDGDGGVPPGFRTALDRLMTANADTELTKYLSRFNDAEMPLVLVH